MRYSHPVPKRKLEAMDLLFKHIERLDTKAVEKMLLEEKSKNQ